MSSPKSTRPPGLVLPALVFGLGLVAMSIGVPKELTLRRLNSSGVRVAGRPIGIEHSNNKEILTLAYQVGGLDYPVVLERPDSERGHSTEVVYLPDDPKVATANLAGDTKTAHEYVFAGLLELLVGGWVMFAAIRYRRRKLLHAIAKGKK